MTMCNKLGAAIDDALDRRMCNKLTRGRPQRFLLTTSIHWGTNIVPWKRTFLPWTSPLRHFLDARVQRDTTGSANAAWVTNQQ